MAAEAGRAGHGLGRRVSRPLILVGEGRIGLSLLADLAGEEDLRPIVAGRSTERPALMREFPETPYLVTGVPGAPLARLLGEHLERETADPILIFCVPDDDLCRVASGWAESAAIKPRTVLHTSGVHSARALSAWQELGVPAAAWHPLVAVAAPGRGAFRRVWFGVDGDAAAEPVARDLAHRLGGRTHAVRPEARAHYHAAGVFASNYLMACLRIAADELRRASDDAELAALLPLAESALRNLGELGLREGVTGPVARGDVRTVASHLAVLAPGRAAVYRGLGRELLELIGDRLDPGVRARLEAELAPSDPPRADRRPDDE